MTLMREQSAFLIHVAELIREADELGFSTVGGELYRTPEQQALHVKNGRDQTMQSQHLKRLAVDLNFFRDAPDGTLKLTNDVEELRPLGEFWENLDPANRWGGNWSLFKDIPHFERREGSAAATVNAATVNDGAAGETVQGATESAAGISADRPRRGQGIIVAAVGPKSPNRRDDVETVQRLVNLSAGAGRVPLENPLKADGVFGEKTLTGIMAFQRTALGDPAPSGLIEPDGQTLDSLCESLPTTLDAGLLALIFLRAGEADLAELSTRMARAMANRLIDAPLRQAHFLAQVGHESGELRFRKEIASGDAYEGRMDLGNDQPGDGRKYKGRGLIQLTGKANYAEYGRAIGREQEILTKPELIEVNPDLCVDVAGWFWAKRNLNILADADDLTNITTRINGRLNGLEDRRRLLTRAKSIIGI